MSHHREAIKKEIIRQFSHCCSGTGEKTLVEAYELGRKAASNGLGELEILSCYQEALLQSDSIALDKGQKEQLIFFTKALSECFAPYDMRQRGFLDLVNQLKEQNAQLQNEIECRKEDIRKVRAAEKKLRNYSEQLRRLTAKQDRIREKERIRIAREIHDELGQMLTVLKIDLSMTLRKTRKEKRSSDSTGEFEKEMKKLVGRIDTIIESVQRISEELRPEVLDDLGLKEAIEWQASEFEKRTGIRFHLSVEKAPVGLDEPRSTAIFRIFQETLTNVLRHSDATRVNIVLKQEEAFIILQVQDNGKGMSRDQLEDSGSLGIMGMCERSQFLGGDITFSGENGTTVTLKLPLKDREG